MHLPYADDQLGDLSGQTLPSLFSDRCRLSAREDAYTQFNEENQNWETLCWEEIHTMVSARQDWLRSLKLAAGDCVAIMLKNGTEWVAFDLAAMGLDLITVPLHASDRSDNVSYILQQTKAKIILIQGSQQWTYVQPYKEQNPELLVVSFARLADVRVQCAADLIPSQNQQEYTVGSRDSAAAATIIYTSGTTRRPKGVILSHQNIIWNASASSSIVPVRHDDTLLSFLPLSHAFERTAGYYIPMLKGASVTYARNLDTLMEDFQETAPTAALSVPRFLEKVYAKIREIVQQKTWMQRWIFHLALRLGWRVFCQQQKAMPLGPVTQIIWRFFDRLIYRKFKKRFGGRLRFIVSGGAPLSYAAAKFFASMGIPIIQGYGMTEASPIISANKISRNNIKSVGELLPGLSASFSEQGELKVKSPGVMQAYLNDEASTGQAFDEDGWLCTGDIGYIKNRHLFISGRIKDQIVLSTGKKIALNPIESVLQTAAFFDQVLIFGDRRPFLVALAVANQKYFAHRKISDPHKQEEYALKKSQQDLKNFPLPMRIKKLFFCQEAWTVENGLMTAAYKLNRQKIAHRYHTDIEKIYSDALQKL